MSGFSFTPEQAAAITTKEGPILVSAGAGSGKTRVLVQRLLENLKEGCDITEYLVITYTKAAAAELKIRILDGINKLLANDPTNAALRRQSHLIHKASIGTIHSFCIGIIRENVHLLNISPDLRVAEENEAKLLKNTVLERIIEERYESIGEDKDFCALADAVSAGRDDSKLIGIIKETYEKLQSHPYPEDWMDEQCRKLAVMNEEQDAAETVWGKILLSRAKKTAKYWITRIDELLCEAAYCEDFINAYGESLSATLHSLNQFADACDRSWDEAAHWAKIDFPRAKNVRGYDDFKDTRKRCKAVMDKLAKGFSTGSKELMLGMANVRPVIRGLFSVVSQFSERYGEEKRARGLLDFSDQEHMAVKLLTDRETLEPTELAGNISRRYREIMVDEYQDVNAVQELLFNAVSRNGKNIFMVGDVKQSIYRFRLADPSIFMEKYDFFKLEPEKDEGRKILLKKNFRSNKGILDCVNFVFESIMSPEFGDMKYTEDEYLEWGGTTKDESEEPCIELCVIDAGTDEDDEAAGKDELEAEFVAKRIAELSAKYKYSEMAILLRSMKDKSWRYARALARAGIPVYSDGSDGFYKTLEITIMISMLSVIDNPRQDVPLISLLRSPIYGFTADELAEIRLADKDSDFYTALTKASETMEKAGAFLAELDDFRDAAAEMSADRLIWYIYDKTGFMAIVSAMEGGSARAENLMCLFEYAKSYENNGYKGLFSFISYIRKQMESGIEPVRESGAETDAVRIMSIHKSKGLEFPVVFVSGMAKRFNQSDAQAPMLIHPKLGAGPKLIEPEARIEYDTLARRAVSTVLREETLSEELRILYVAMTRAREKLIMTCSFGDCEKHITKLAADASVPVSPQVLASSGSMADWVLLTALNRSESSAIRYGIPVVPYDKGEPWLMRIIKAGDVKVSTVKRIEASIVEEITDERHDIAEKLNWRYAYDVSEIPSKLTATELKGRYQDSEVQEEAEQLESHELPVIIRKPEFISAQERELTAAEKGTALHLAMQYIDYSKCRHIRDVRSELDRLESLGVLNEKQKKVVSPWKILTLFDSPLGKRILNAEKLYREFKFSLLVPAEKWHPGAGNEQVLLQGVVDCCIVENGELTIIDYKTDYVTDETIHERAEMYRSQLEAYEVALAEITGMQIREKVLYFFSKNCEIKL